MTLNDITKQLFELLDAADVQHQKLFNHSPSRTSDESRQVRKAASGYDTTGAKALVQKLTNRNKTTEIAVFVLPGNRQFDANAVRHRLPDVKRTRFLTSEEVRDATSLEIGAIPPFGRLLFSQIDHLYFDPSLLECGWVGFNAASHQHSVIMKPADLVAVAQPDDIFCFSVSPALTICDEIVEGRNYPHVAQL